ncbi:type II toxin-antitoxin system HicB family antitoxin [Oceanibaculum indicum]|uniref:HicB-like antitoxin of toxin-antitoxin system domain-containing protein n=1 Tax=Oceanibaculum indicum P24 TaxID=1207063 RepID=K2IH26_9PROT|nr:type II toxin-antitoxin system HicB family antitoxin [Oceanibaculum indicum]EKE69416.1 hypothetical protein P24_16517 [Oceanibaculum indicum P24]
MLTYPVVLTRDDNGTLLATCPDLPEVTSYGETAEAAVRQARNAIEEAIAARLDAWEPVPEGTDGAVQATLSTLLTLKVTLYRTLWEQGKTRADLMRLLGWKRTQVDRLFDPNHATQLDQFDAAFAALGKGIDVAQTDLTSFLAR